MIERRYEKYAESHTSPEPGILKNLYRETNLKTVYPRMISGHMQGKFLEMISHMIHPDKILEIGTFTGYSTICLASGLAKEGEIHTIEVMTELKEIFMKYFKETGIISKVKVHTGKAMDIINELNEKFDLVYIDADKDNYLNYYKAVFPKVNKGGFIIADNAFWGGKVLKQVDDKETQGIIEFNEFVQKDNRVENILLTIRDGLMMIRKK